MTTFVRPQYGQFCKTLRKDIVRNEAERQIADFLYEQGFQYEYEPYLDINGRLFRPDFRIQSKRRGSIYIKYFGLQGISSYNFDMWVKQGIYDRYGINCIYLYPEQMGNFDAFILSDYMSIAGERFPQKKYFNWRKQSSAPTPVQQAEKYRHTES